jgi:hypothetical protein
MSPAADARLSELFNEVESKLQSTDIGTGRWYILAIACLVAGPDPEAAAQLYLHLINQPTHSDSSTRQFLIRRLREALVKSIAIVGVCKPIEAILAIAKIERDEDKDYSCTREDWKRDQASHDTGMAWLNKIYGGNTDATLGLFDAHRDFAWISKEITYGFYLGDRQVLDDLDTELVVLSSIMSQNLPLETHWHIRGTRRIGVSRQDTQVLWDTIYMIAKHFGVELNRVPRVDDVESDV